MDAKNAIESGKAILGIELGSTRIKAVLTDPSGKPIAQGSHEWENKLVDGLWTYSTDDVWHGMRQCYESLQADVHRLYDTDIENLAAIGVSAMMHGYLPFDKEGRILTPFRTWRNTNTGQAAKNSLTFLSTTSPCAGASRISIRPYSTARSMYRRSTSSPLWPDTCTGNSPAARCWALAMPRA